MDVWRPSLKGSHSLPQVWVLNCVIVKTVTWTVSVHARIRSSLFPTRMQWNQLFQVPSRRNSLSLTAAFHRGFCHSNSDKTRTVCCRQHRTGPSAGARHRDPGNACSLCSLQKENKKVKEKKWLFGVNRSRWNQPAKVILVINKGWMDVEGKNTVDWPDCWIHLKDLWSMFLVSGSLFYSWQFCNRQSSPPGLLLYDRMTDSGPVYGWVPTLWHLRYFGYFSVPLWF